MKLLVTYMEMRNPPTGWALPPPSADLSICEEHLSVADYVALYRAVGTSLDWDSRLRLPQEALAAFLSASSTRIYVLREVGKAVGFCEFDAVDTPDIELTHFGLVPAAYGRRIGPFLLDTALRAVWSATTRRLWLHTDTKDHAKAQATYARAGFAAYQQQVEDFPD